MDRACARMEAFDRTGTYSSTLYGQMEQHYQRDWRENRQEEHQAYEVAGHGEADEDMDEIVCSKEKST